MDDSVKAIAQALNSYVKATEKREDLTPSLRDYLTEVEEAIFSLNDISKRFKRCNFTPQFLYDILAVWKNAAKFVVIKRIEINVENCENSNYSGCSFTNIQELQDKFQDMIKYPGSERSTLLSTELHSLRIVL